MLIIYKFSEDYINKVKMKDSGTFQWAAKNTKKKLGIVNIIITKTQMVLRKDAKAFKIIY